MDKDHTQHHRTVSEVAKEINESSTTIRNWMKQLKEEIPTIKAENGYNYFDDDATKRLLLIKQMNQEEGYTIKQIKYHLSTDGETLSPEQFYSTKDLIEKIEALQEGQQVQEQFNQALMQRLDDQNTIMEKQKEYIEESLKERDKKLLETLNEAKANKKDQGFFARIFKK